MKPALTFTLSPTLAPLVPFVPPLLVVSCMNWAQHEEKDGLISVLLIGLGISACMRVHHIVSYPTYELLSTLPYPRRRGLWLPFAATGASLCALGALLHVIESSGVAGGVLRYIDAHLGVSFGADLTPRRRAAMPLPWLLGYPALAFYGSLAWLTRMRQRASPARRSLWSMELVVYSVVAGALGGAAQALTLPESEVWSAGFGGLCLLAALPLARVARGLLTEETDETSPLSPRAQGAGRVPAAAPAAAASSEEVRWSS